MKRSPPSLGAAFLRDAAELAEPVRRRGRPKGSGKPWAAGSRWTPFALARIWAQIRHMIERGDIERGDAADIRTAARRIASRGYAQGVSGAPPTIKRDGRGVLTVTKPGGPGKLWLSRDVKPEPNDDAARGTPKPGRYRLVTRRNDDPAERFRVAYHTAERRRKRDPAFRESCELWLRFEREISAGGDAAQAFMKATGQPLP